MRHSTGIMVLLEFYEFYIILCPRRNKSSPRDGDQSCTSLCNQNHRWESGLSLPIFILDMFFHIYQRKDPALIRRMEKFSLRIPYSSAAGPFVDLTAPSAYSLCLPRPQVSVQNHSDTVENQVPERKMLIIRIFLSFSSE